jgi:putative phosphoesterase
VRIAILSDIHGNLPALEAVMKDVDEQAPDQIWCGGDLGWLGPHASECIAYVRDAGWPTVKGNTDVWIAGDPQTVESEEDRQHHKEVAAQHNISDDDARWLVSLPIGHAGSGSLLMVHGTPDSPFTAPFPDEPPAAFTPFEGKAALVVFGHVHVPFVRQLSDGTVVANPGSVGLPADGATASYMLVDQHGPGWTIRHRRVAFDVASVVEQARAFGGRAGERFADLLQ